LWYCYIFLDLEEHEKRNFSKFSWSNSIRRDSTVLLRSWTSACATVFSSIENEVPNGVAFFFWLEKIM